MAIRQSLTLQTSVTGNVEVRDSEGQHAFTGPRSFVDEVLLREVAFVDKVITVADFTDPADGEVYVYQRGAQPITTDLVNGQRYQPVVVTYYKHGQERLAERQGHLVALDGLGRGYIVK